MEPRRNGAFLRATLVVLGLGGVSLLGLGAFVHEEMHVGMGDEILHDDFGFRVKTVTTESALDGGALRPRGRFVVVELEIANHAKRVPFQLHTWTPVLFDAERRVYLPAAAAQSALEAPHGARARREGSIAAGERTTSWLVYDVPTDARDVRFRVQWGGAVVNALAGLVFGAKDVALGTLEAAPSDSSASDVLELGARAR